MAATADTHHLGVGSESGHHSEHWEPGEIVVGASGRFEGLLTFRGRARIDGEVVGEIVCRGTLELGEMARVNATIEVDELIVAGTLEGEATARSRIELMPTARVKGTIRAPRLCLADGCVVDGRCETGVAES
jgi:cytoskeletal protein CcmA (bactofilin family)